MKIKKLITSLLCVTVSTFVYANEIYIEQVGDSSTISITQDGTSNRIGDSLSPTFIGGGSNTVTIQQIGSTNQLDAVVNGSAASLVIDTTGSGNIQTVNCGTTTSAGCSSSVIKQIVTGDDNTITQNLGAGANHNSEITVIGSTNTITHTSTNTGAASAIVNATGDSNTIGVTQSGTTAKSVTVNSTGNLNNITINQSN
jgi:hypothetical protein